ncbi:MAG: hypothetical protein XU15_C0011G0163 [candidate division NC10 bacterium CSP1-5]|nr:MAG: hypothetical protein XU15_C0011G0019 [candidate division NC10 bacterium CSP1-5]KRT69481.1 MAG: hypothetical protein XU15_C0011G0163 [candidate division NC10 bacterium CSP1-5]
MRARNPTVVQLPVTFYAEKDHVAAIFYVGESTLGIRFESPEQMLEFFSRMMDQAVKVWPDNSWIKEYLSD